ncbi:MAG: hypothetical protein RR654_07040 [Oscillospiraceae bacterium]
MSFETAAVDTSFFIRAYILTFFKILVFVTLIVAIATFLLNHYDANRLSKAFMSSFLSAKIVILFFKFFVSTTTVWLVFFYDYENALTSIVLQDKMPIATLFLGILSIYESLSAVVEIILVVLDKLNNL